MFYSWGSLAHPTHIEWDKNYGVINLHCDAYLGTPYLSYQVELQPAVIAISLGLTAALPSSCDKGCPDKHYIGNVYE